jgi:tetratricopeptide (TPR) repeat protein
MSWWKKLTNTARGVFGAATPESDSGGGGCHHENAIHLRQGTAEFEWFIARAELETTKNLEHGASHLANLLSYDPGNPEWIELLERYLAEAGPNPERLIPRGDKLYYSTEAMRAYIWHKQGRLADAVDLLSNVVRNKTDARYLEAWALGWLEPSGAAESLPAQASMMLFAVTLNRFPEARMSPLSQLRQIQRWARLCERCAAQWPKGGMGAMMRAGLLRKAGMFDEALAVVRPALQKAPDWHLATALGLIFRAKGDCPEADRAFRKALELDPSDNSARLEAGDMYFERQQWQPALMWYEDALAKERKQPWAQPSALFCRWKLSDEERHLEELIKLAKGGNERAGQLCNQAFGGGLPEPADASANGLRQIRDAVLQDPKNAPTGEVSLTVTCLEAPSNFLAFRLEMDALGQETTLKAAFERVPQPDPRQPISEVKYQLWKYDGTDASPGLPLPGEDVVKRIAELAAAPFDEAAGWAAASRTAEAVGKDRVGEALATMVHPPAVPDGWSALAWLPRVQHAAAQVAAQVDAGWEGSIRREALLSVLHGPQDWATEAAIRALARLGRENEAWAPDIHDAFQKLADHRPDAGYCCWERTLYEYWLMLPHLFPQEREAMQKILRKMNEQK